MSGPRRQAVRLSFADAEAEFSIHRDTLSKRLQQAGQTPGEDSLWSLKQICAAVYTDKEVERARLAKEQADRIALDNAERRRLLISVEDAATLARKFTFAAREKIRGVSSLTVEEKNDIIKSINGLANVDFSKLPDNE
jgi:phage terminase Nu1 subunit (DNA packaging protein)